MDLQITVHATLDGNELIEDINIGSDEEINDQLFDLFIAQFPDEEENDDFCQENIVFEVTDWQDLNDYESLQGELSELSEYTGDLELEVLETAYACGVSFDNADEAYQGEYTCDENFAEEMAESLGLINDHVTWPYTCIDWEWAARELMHDYFEEDGHYFRCL